MKLNSVPDLLLVKRGLVFPSSTGGPLDDDQVRALELELSAVGYVLTSRLRERLVRCSLNELVGFRAWALAVLLAHSGGDQKHQPLFRNFPDGIPVDTTVLWWQKVLVHFLQAEEQPCLFCRRTSTTHVLNPCKHVVCEHCFDGANYSACPVCEHHVDQSSPFFRPTSDRETPSERVTFKLLDLGASLVDDSRSLFVGLCERRQALSPDDRDALVSILREYKSDVLSWLPTVIPVRENIANVFGTLFQNCDPAEVLPHARRHMQTATDVLRFVAVLSGTDGSLLKEPIFKPVNCVEEPSRFWGRVAELFTAPGPGRRALTAQILSAATYPDQVADAASWMQQEMNLTGSAPLMQEVNKQWWDPSVKALTKFPWVLNTMAYKIYSPSICVPLEVCRFKMAKLSRPLRRALLDLLEGMEFDPLAEDMLRHRSYWVWVGEFLHPHEYASRFPKTARAFQFVRKKAPDGTKSPHFESWYARVEQSLQSKDIDSLLRVLLERPGEFARRLDHVLRIAGDSAARDRVIATFNSRLRAFATPVLLTLRAHFSKRQTKAAVRVYWPKARVSTGVSGADKRPILVRKTVEPIIRGIDVELLRRFAAKTQFADGVIDDQLRTIIVPFNERTASRSAVSLPRGSRLVAPSGKLVRLFLHWCQPKNGRTTDLDLSVAFYDDVWRYRGVCSYYELELRCSTDVIAHSAGDLRDGPWPDGATEFVDLHRERALAAGFRYAVVVINNYAGLPFSLLERGFAGVMLRDDPAGSHFDPRTVHLKFALSGENGVFLPLVFDLRESIVHWLDVQARGEFEMNNVETSNAAIAKVCPELMTYFASGVRPSMFDLALLHAAARCQRVILRGQEIRQFVRGLNETTEEFYRRLVNTDGDSFGPDLALTTNKPILAILYRGDIDLPQDSASYALFRERVAPSLAASDLIT